MSHHNTTVVVLDNGGGLIKAGIGGDRDPAVILPNCLVRPLSSKKYSPFSSADLDLTSASVRRPFDRGHLTHPDFQVPIWSHLFSSLLHVTPSLSSLLLTHPLFSPPNLQSSLLDVVFEDFQFNSVYVSDSPSLVHLYEASKGERRASLVVDSGFSFTHVAPVVENFTVNYGVKRMDLGGKALTNYLKELVSYRAVNVMDESFLVDDVKERLCFVSMDVDQDLHIARKTGRENHFRCTYVLPDGVTHTKGYIKDEGEAKRYLAEDDKDLHKVPASEEDKNQIEINEFSENRKRKIVDLSQNEFSLTNERFLVPEMLFHPADLGMNQAGLAECIVRAVNSCHSYLHPVLYESIILTGGSTKFPRFAERLERELRPLVPDKYRVKITSQEDPIVGVWRGGSLLASSPDFENMCVTKAEYEELGSARCSKRFFC